jgi:hypothetical protein
LALKVLLKQAATLMATKEQSAELVTMVLAVAVVGL